MDVCDFLLEQPVLLLPITFMSKKEYGVRTAAFYVSACTVFEKKDGFDYSCRTDSTPCSKFNVLYWHLTYETGIVRWITPVVLRIFVISVNSIICKII